MQQPAAAAALLLEMDNKCATWGLCNNCCSKCYLRELRNGCCCCLCFLCRSSKCASSNTQHNSIPGSVIQAPFQKLLPKICTTDVRCGGCTVTVSMASLRFVSCDRGDVCLHVPACLCGVGGWCVAAVSALQAAGAPHGWGGGVECCIHKIKVMLTFTVQRGLLDFGR